MKRTARSLIDNPIHRQATTINSNGEWIPARSMNHKHDKIIDRIKHAYGVLIGKYDALDWEQKDTP